MDTAGCPLSTIRPLMPGVVRVGDAAALEVGVATGRGVAAPVGVEVGDVVGPEAGVAEPAGEVAGDGVGLIGVAVAATSDGTVVVEARAVGGGVCANVEAGDDRSRVSVTAGCRFSAWAASEGPESCRSGAVSVAGGDTIPGVAGRIAVGSDKEPSMVARTGPLGRL